MSDILFHKVDLRQAIEGHQQKMFAEIDGLSENRLLNTSIDDLCDYYVKDYVINVPKLNEAGIQADYGDAKIDVSHRFEYVRFDDRPTFASGTRLLFFVPYEGDEELFKCRPSSFNFNPPRADVRENELVFTYERTSSETDRIQEEFKRELENTQEYLGWIERDVAPFNLALRNQVKNRIEARRKKIMTDRGIVEKIGFPLRHREGLPQTYVAPQVKRKITPKLPPGSNAPFNPEPTLDVSEYEHILSIISNMVLVMERGPHAFRGMKEEDLRLHFLVQLNGHYEGQATGETFNSEGKTDILIRVDGKNIFIAECKFWGGPEKFTQALDQLLGYTTWRDCKIALLIFNRRGSLSNVISKIPETVKTHPNFKRQVEYKSATGFRFIFGRRDDMSRELLLTIIVFEVPDNRLDSAS